MITKISSSEKAYLLEGIRQNIRADGRKRLDYRSVSIETDILPLSNGSARVSIAKSSTDILASVKVQVGTPLESTPNCGRIELSAECSPSVSAKLEGRVAEEMNTELTELMNRLICSSPKLDLESLCIISGKSCWILQIDVMVFDSGGNLPDIVSLAVYSALRTTCIPKISLIGEENKEIQVDSDPAMGMMFDASVIPLCITLSHIGVSFITDATLEEELCVTSQISVAVDSKGNVCGIHKSGSGSLRTNEMESMVDSARNLSVSLFESIEASLESQFQKDANNNLVEKFGFLT